MAKHLTPIVGLAVVMALALAAVFGSMSLANPAHAQAVNMTVELEEGAVEWFEFNDELGDYPSDVTRSGTHTVVITPGGTNADNTTGTIVKTTSATQGDYLELSPRSAAIQLEAVVGQAGKTARVIITLDSGTAGTARDPFVIAVRVTDVGESTPATVLRQIPDMTVAIPSGGAQPVSDELDLSEHFANGMGPKGEIRSYSILTNSANVEVSDGEAAAGFADRSSDALVSTDGTVYFRSGSAVTDATSLAERTVYVTIVAMDNVGGSDNPEISFYVVVAGTATTSSALPRFTPDSTSPGSNTRYTVEFMTKDDQVANTLIDDLVIEFHEDYSLPSSISTSSVTINVQDSNNDVGETGTDGADYTFNPSNVDVDGEKVIISLGDMDNQDVGRDHDVGISSTIEVVFRQSAGISNPSEAGGYNLVAIDFGNAASIEYDDGPSGLETMVPRKISLSEEDGGLGDTVMATGKGFENGVTLTFFLDKPDSRGRRNGDINLGEEVLCVVPQTGSDNVGSCSFTVTHPTFSAGDNFVAAFDGDGNIADVYGPNFMDDDQKFVLKASISATPSGGSPGELMQIQVVDFPTGAISKVELAREPVCGGTHSNPAIGDTGSCSGSVDSTGAGAFSVVIPNWARAGRQELRVTAGGKNATTNVDVVGPQISATPGTVLANQRVSLVGVGFSAGEEISRRTDAISSMTIGGKMIPWSRINGAEPVSIDNGGNWSASVDLPLAEATTASGERTIRVTDSGGRSGVVLVTIPERTVTITPESGRVGTIAVVRGTGFPSKNDEGSSFNVEIVYQAENGKSTTVSALPDASGRFEVQLRIPTTAAIPSSNSVLVSFDDDDKVTVPVSVAHEVPEGIIQTSESSGGPGSTVTVSGEGFKAFVPISRVLIGSLEVTPSPKPQTDGNGMMSFNIIVPGLDVGIQTIEVNVGGTVSSVGFTVTESGINPGDIKMVAEAIEPLGENLEVVWHFNNDTKAWTFYDGEEGSDLTHMITGETYLIQVKSSVEVILNRDTRSLTCVGGNCWNQIVW